MSLVPTAHIKTIDDARRAIQKLASNILGPNASPTFYGLTLTTPLLVPSGGTGLATLTDHGLLLGSGTGAITPLAEATDGQIPIGDTDGDPILATITGTANRVTVNNAAGSITLTGPQDIHTGASPTFAGLTLTNAAVIGSNSVVFQPGTDSTTFLQVLDADGGTPIFNVDTTNERVGVGTTAPNAPLEVKGAKPGVVGGHQSGMLQVTGTGGEFYCAVITGHNSFNGNTQLWYLGNTSSSSHNDIAFINRQNAPIHFYTNNTSRMTIDAAGNVGIGITSPKTKLTIEGALTLKEQAAADGDTAAYGQVWCKDDVPNTLWFVNDLGTEIRIAPQDLQTSASPTFAGLTLSDLTQGSVIFTGASGVISQDNSNLFWDDTNNRLGIGINTGFDPRTGLTISGDIDILHTATEADDHVFEIDVDAAGYGDVKAIDIDYITGAISIGEDEGIILINIDEIAATGGDVFGVEVLATEGAAGSTTTVYGLKAGALVGPIHQDSGDFVNPTTGTDSTIGSSVTAVTIGFTQTPDTITDSGNGFGGFIVGEIVVVTGATTPANNTTYTITVATAGALTVTPQPDTVENDGASITVKGNVPAMFDGSSGTTTTIFEAQNEYILIGAATAFEEIEFILTTPTSNPGIKPTFWYSTAGSHQFTQFTPVDGTNGFRNTGVVAWDADDLSSHGVNTDTGTYDIKIIRTKAGSLSPSPILGYAKVVATTEYLWDKNGDVNINSLTLATVAAEGSDVDKFLVSSSGVVKYRTGAQVLSDIGGQASGGVANPSSAISVYISGDQTINDATLTTVAFNTEDYDLDTEFNTTTHIFTCKTAGYYTVTGFVTFDIADAGANIAVYMVLNGTAVAQMNSEMIGAVLWNTLFVHKDLYLAVDDEVKIQVYQDSDGNYPIKGGAPGQRTFMTIHKISG